MTTITLSEEDVLFLYRVLNDEKLKLEAEFQMLGHIRRRQLMKGIRVDWTIDEPNDYSVCEQLIQKVSDSYEVSAQAV